MGWIKFLFRWTGRIHGGHFLIGLLGASLVSAAGGATMLFAFVPRSPSGGWLADELFWCAWTLGQLPGYAIASLVARRLHDLGKSARWLIPGIAYYLAATLALLWWPDINGGWLDFAFALPVALATIWLVAASSEPRDNRYGSPANLLSREYDND